MPSLIIPPSIFYTVLLPNAEKIEDRLKLLHTVLQYHEVITSLFIKFKYGKGDFRDPVYYKKLQSELLQMEQYLKDLDYGKLTAPYIG